MSYAVDQVLKFLKENEGKIEAGKAAVIQKRAEAHREHDGIFGGGQAMAEIFDDVDLEYKFRDLAEQPEYMQIGVHAMHARNRTAEQAVVSQN